jgi:ubiquinone/menaquinone biosynthesis C-methylase UbiE
MDRLIDADELLDGPLDDPATLAGNLRDLRRVNRWLSGASLSARAIDALAAHRPVLSILDVGTGGADIPMTLLARAKARGKAVSVVALDSRPEVLAAAIMERPVLEVTDGLRLQVGDGRALPFADRSFDVVHSSMVFHHCAPDEMLVLLREMARVARLGVVVNDLDRSRLGWIGAWLMSHLLTRNRYTRHDAPLSVRRAHRVEELLPYIRRANLTPVTTIRGALGRRYAIAAVPSPPRSDPPDPLGAGS